MALTIFTRSSLSSLSLSWKLNSSKILTHGTQTLLLKRDTNFSRRSLGFCRANASPDSTRMLRSVCFYSTYEESRAKFQRKESGLDWPILKRWDVPWKWQTFALTSLACGLSFVLTGIIETKAIPYLGLEFGELSLDEKAEIIFVRQAIGTAVVLGVVYTVTNMFRPLPGDLFRYGLRDPFSLQKGWLLWAAIGLVGALLAVGLTGVSLYFFSGDKPRRENDALVLLLPLIGSSSLCTACLLGITGVLAPLLEETFFRGFFMVSLTTWLPTPVSVLISGAVFAGAHRTPELFPLQFVLGSALGFSYAQTRNLLTPITIHAVWNSGVILFLTFLKLQGCDINKLVQTSR
ncbi:uncharacterized protein LOC132294859 isoform X2 [Cornus florida]|uniref:uncharacterized protein LOC132294859 isoform X2 n=1 Tax=Cornus florida TaxID=4283 RepID=UPI00289C79F2|nr:uncharacterized protein LOC132294859 isoform X2 [Cornus florida]